MLMNILFISWLIIVAIYFALMIRLIILARKKVICDAKQRRKLALLDTIRPSIMDMSYDEIDRLFLSSDAYMCPPSNDSVLSAVDSQGNPLQKEHLNYR